MSRWLRRDLACVAAVILIGLCPLSSCASKPKPSLPPKAAAVEKAAEPKTLEAPVLVPAQASPAQAVPAPVAAQAQSPKQEEGTALRTAEPAALARTREEREAIETQIVFGAPSSLARARDLAAKAQSLKSEDAAALDALALGISSIVYPEVSQVSSPSPNGPPIADSQGLLIALAEVKAGRFPEIVSNATGSSLAEIIPALVLLVTDSNDSARLAFDALDRFARLGVPSILPSIIRGMDAERRKAWQEALGLYRSALAIAPDAWSASLGMGRSLLALTRSSEALALLSPLAQAHSGFLAFDRCYAFALYANGRYNEADPYVARVLTRDPQDSRLILMRARLLLRAKAYQQALPLLDAYGTVDPANRLYILLRSLESEGLRSREEALKWARRGLASYPDDPELLLVAARLLFAGPAFGREEARSLAARTCELVPIGAAAPADTEAETGAVILAARNAAAAEAARLLARDAASRYQWSVAATYLARAGSTFDDKALKARILRKSGDKRGDSDFATAWYRDEPKSEAAIEAYLRALVESGDEKSAQEAIARILPGTSSSSLRAVIYILQSRLQKSDDAALGLLRSALVENADNAEALAAVSDIQMRRKDYAKARFYLKQAIAIDPDNPELEAQQSQLDALAPQ
jgi:tetratricopeptide (TPR) repeat protein